MKASITVLLIATALFLGGCSSLQGTALSCGFDDESGYVELINLDTDPRNTAALAKLCGFLYQSEEVASNETETTANEAFRVASPIQQARIPDAPTQYGPPETWRY